MAVPSSTSVWRADTDSPGSSGAGSGLAEESDFLGRVPAPEELSDVLPSDVDLGPAALVPLPESATAQAVGIDASSGVMRFKGGEAAGIQRSV